MYKIVSYEENYTLPESFSYFETAFMIQQLDYPEYLIEYWDIENCEREVVWNPRWEEGNEEC